MAPIAAPSPARGLLSPLIPLAMLAFAAAALLVAAFGGCTLPTRSQDLAVTSFAPEVWSGERPTLRVRFSRPVVSGAEVGIALASAPVVIYPPVRLTASWSDRQTLLVRSLEDLRPSTRYRIAFTRTLATRVKMPSFAFINKPVEIEGLSGEVDGTVPPRPELVLSFNQPVAARQVARRCHLRLLADAGERDPRGPTPTLLPREASATGTKVALCASAPLEQGRRYQLRCEGLIGSGGDAAMEEPWSRELLVYPRHRGRLSSIIRDTPVTDRRPRGGARRATFRLPASIPRETTLVPPGTRVAARGTRVLSCSDALARSSRLARCFPRWLSVRGGPKPSAGGQHRASLLGQSLRRGGPPRARRGRGR